MRVLDKPLFALITELYLRPLSTEPWTPPGWKPKEKEGKVLGHVSAVTRQLARLMRDLNDTLEKRFMDSKDNPALAREYQILGALGTEVMTVMIESQIRLDLIESGVSVEEAEYFCVREDGVVLECACQRLAAKFSGLLDDLLLQEGGDKGTQFV